jgi:hypothetical protein
MSLILGTIITVLVIWLALWSYNKYIGPKCAC